MKIGFASLVATLFASAVATNLQHEHKGDVFNHVHSPGGGVDGVITSGKPAGHYKKINNETLYITHAPRGCKKPNTAILYFTDIFGVQLVNNRLLADSLAKAGFLVIVPDLFRGDPVPADALSNPNSTFSLPDWQTRHPQAQIETVINSALETVKTHFHATKIGSVGYCFGGKYVARYLAANKGIDAGFTAHPSGTLASEWKAVAKPISVAFGALDTLNTPENRTTIEGIFLSGNKTFQTALFSNAEHGFAVRTDLSIKQKAFAQEGAYWQAVRWLDAWVKDEI